MSYVDGLYDRNRDRVHVVERLHGQRHYREYPANYVFYYPDARGKFQSVYGTPVSRFHSRSHKEFHRELKMHADVQTYESDINPVFRCLEENYRSQDPPVLHAVFFDIETAFDHERGFAPAMDAFNPVTAISLYLDWLDELVTLVIAPDHMSAETAREITQEFPNCMLFTTEADMFTAFLDLIEDADVLSGWNSEGYDIPYMVNRVTRVMSKDDTRRFCLWGQYPKLRTYERFGKEEQTYDLIGRVHMDYLQLYKKYNYESRHSYKLDFIGEMEVGDKKVEYEGTLDQLYNKDFKKFIDYNRQDVLLLVKIHNKLKFLDLANAMAHENTVLLPTVMGSVAMIEQAILNEAHDRGLVVPDKQRSNSDDGSQAAGAYVANPQKGMHEWVGALDIASMYPSSIRALNMAPETVMGQVRQTLTEQYMQEKRMQLARERKRRREDDDDDVSGSRLWEGLFGSLEYEAIMRQERGTILWVDFEDGHSEEMSAAEIWHMIFDSHRPWVISANGTIFTYEKEGVIPGLLTRWYNERKHTQHIAKQSSKFSDGVELSPEFLAQVEACLSQEQSC